MPHGEDITAVKAVLQGLVDAWGRGDAEAYGAMFTEDAGYTTFVGTFYQGRRDIVNSHRILFAKFLHGTQLADEIVDISFPSPGVAVVNGRGDTYKGERPDKLTKVQTYTLVRQEDGQWRIAAFHNTKRKPLLESLSYRFAPGLRPGAGR
ncbi:MAG TPA: SgcJ/EcaC family oxidoreductase [Streptomyces sp.]|nr:SgcJ/EcaC family oxidoreductase [Streptomyces sp.]